MSKPKTKVKKTLVRNCEQKIKPNKKQVVRDVECSYLQTAMSPKENELDQPTLCSSEALAQYLSDVRVSEPPPLTLEDLNAEKTNLSAKMTKKLNFNFNDRIYKNLIELNGTTEELKKSKIKRPQSSLKKDMEPNIEDFSEDIKDRDSPPNIPVIKPKFKVVKKIDSKNLHMLVSKFDNL